jgi:hypothetical protein
VEFIEKYAGASIENDDRSQLVEILGFSDASMDIEELDSPVVDTHGFLMIADAVYHVREGERTIDTRQHAFAQDASGERLPGIYHSVVSGKNPEPAFKYAFARFDELLEEMVAREGWLDTTIPT